MLLNKQRVNEAIREERKNTLRQMKMEIQYIKFYEMQESSFIKKEVHSNKCLPQETKKISNKQPNITPQGIIKRKTNEAQS